MVLYGFETLTLKGKHRLQVSENKVIRKILMYKWGEVSEEQRILHGEECIYFYWLLGQ